MRSGVTVGAACRGARIAVVVLAAALCAVAGATPAAAAGGPGTLVYILPRGVLVAQAQPGVANNVTISYSSPTNDVVVSDTAGALAEQPDGTAESNCRQFGPTTVACSVSALVIQQEPPSIAVLTGDQADRVSADPSLPAGLPYAAEAGGGADFLIGSRGNDFLYGGGGGDRISGGDGSDVLTGEDGGDILRGEGANDLLNGGAGHDKMFGGAGRDWIWAADKQRDPVIDCGADRDQAAIFDRGLDGKPKSC